MAKPNLQGTGNDYATAIADAERLSQSLLSVDIRFKTITDSLANLTKDMTKAFDTGKLKKANVELDKFTRGFKELGKLSEKMELAIRIKNMQEIDRAYDRIKDIGTETSRLKTILDGVGLDAFEDLFKNVDVSALPEATQQAIKKMQDEFKDIDLEMPELEFSIIPPKFVLPPMEPFGEEIQTFFKTLDLEIRPTLDLKMDSALAHAKEVKSILSDLKTTLDSIGPEKFKEMFEDVDVGGLSDAFKEAIQKLTDEHVAIELDVELKAKAKQDKEIAESEKNKPPKYRGNEFIEDRLNKQKEALKKQGMYKDFIKGHGSDDREKAYKGLGADDQQHFGKAYMAQLKERAVALNKMETKSAGGYGGDPEGSYLREKDQKEKEKSPLNKLMDKMNLGEGTKDFAEDTLSKVYMPKIPGMGQKSMGTAMSSPGAMAGVGIQAVVEILQKIFQIISEASGFMKAIMKMINITIQMFFRPIGDMLGRFLMPYIRIMMVRTAQNYGKWAQGGFKPEEFGGLMADNALVMFEGLGAIIFDSLVKANFMILRGLVTLGVMIDKGIVWIVTEAVKNIIIQLITVSQYLSTGILGGLKWIVDAVFTIGRQIVITAFDVLRSLISAIFTVVKSAVYPIIAAFDKLINEVNGQGKDPEMRKSFVNELNKVEAGLTNGIGSVEAGIINGMNAIQAPIDKWFNDTIKNINTTAANWIKALNTAVDNLRKTLYDRLDQSAKETNALLDKVEKAIPSALEWYEKQTGPVFTSTMKSSAGTEINTKQNIAATAAVTAKVGTGTEQAVAYNKKLADANRALGSGGSISTTIAGTSKSVAETIKAADAKAVITGKTIASAIGSLKATAETTTTTKTSGTYTKTAEKEGYDYAVETMGHSTAYFNSSEAAGLAGGGYVTGPTAAIIGEGRDPRELVLPMETGARVMAKEMTNILGNNRGDSRPSVNVTVQVQGPIYGIEDFERKFNQLMKKEMAKWSWR